MDCNLPVLILIVLEEKNGTDSFSFLQTRSRGYSGDKNWRNNLPQRNSPRISFSYNVYRKDRNLHDGDVMLLINKELPHMPVKELDNGLEISLG